jgi:hypothetical protein
VKRHEVQFGDMYEHPDGPLLIVNSLPRRDVVLTYGERRGVELWPNDWFTEERKINR